jgi:hypothetical protein
VKLINELAFTLNILAATALLCEIFSQKFLRVFHSDGDDDGGDEIHTDSKKRLVLIRKGG